ncbi:winged helix DNA-binding protein [Zoogloea dura]|uniref:Winged helix DNA-binding protein n=1 Tax=Zoogloea dura TaxID=2728840 RepID=A0A848GEV1_9RHOO|nr:winged helix DNA-binding protein [Zoogloea dura]NML27961.1 winged helix DNA-binding protein [Zoogloea dura]
MTQEKRSTAKEKAQAVPARAWHLGTPHHEAVTTEFEWSILRFFQAFERYCMQIAHISGLADLSFSELILLHVIGLQDTPKTVGLLARQTNTDSVTNVQYSLRKLVAYELVVKIREGKSKVFTYDVTDKGRELINQYAQFRQRVLTEQTKSIESIDRKLSEAARLISMLSGVYDEAVRVSATYNPYVSQDVPSPAAKTRKK